MRQSAPLRFALVGVVNTAVGYAVILLLHYGLALQPLLANVGGYAIGGGVSYVLNRRFSFGSNRPHAQALPRFIGAVAMSFGVNLLVLRLALMVPNLPVAVAQAIAIGSYMVVFYLISRFLVFGRRARVPGR
jgi:putative flippase GtrA